MERLFGVLVWQGAIIGACEDNPARRQASFAPVLLFGIKFGKVQILVEARRCVLGSPPYDCTMAFDMTEVNLQTATCVGILRSRNNQAAMP